MDLAFSTGKTTSHQYFVRLIADRPRMAFLFGTRWFRSGDAQRLIGKLREHQVPIADESIDC